jgi:hypothetical protein
LSEAALDGPQLGVRGFPFLQGETIYLNKAFFKSNILCRTHNNRLSNVDQAGVDAFTALRNLASPTAPRKSKIDGPLFERWLLKTLINIEVVSDFTIKPSLEIVQRAFGARPLPSGSGLFHSGRVGQKISIEDRMTYRRKIFDVNGTKQVCAASFMICNFEFLFTLGEPRFAPGARRPMHHPQKFVNRETLVTFSWSRDPKIAG